MSRKQSSRVKPLPEKIDIDAPRRLRSGRGPPVHSTALAPLAKVGQLSLIVLSPASNFSKFSKSSNKSKASARNAAVDPLPASAVTLDDSSQHRQRPPPCPKVRLLEPIFILHLKPPVQDAYSWRYNVRSRYTV
jgi:hypothetical protein